MINLSHVDRLMEFFPDEIFLVRQAKSGDIRAFIKLYDAYIERVHRYVYLQVVDDQLVEGLTFKTFLNAWKQLADFKASRLPFLSWLYAVAQSQVNDFYRTHKNNELPVADYLISVEHVGGELQKARETIQFLSIQERQALILKFIVCMPIKNIARLMKMQVSDIRALQTRALEMLTAHLTQTEIKIGSRKLQRILAESQVKLLNETSTLEEQLLRYPNYAAQLEPLLRTVLALTLARDVDPLPTFTAYTREALLHYMLTHPQRLQRSLVFSRRLSVAFAALMAALLITGTVQAQSALPGEPLYGLKLASEIVWRAVSLDPLSTDIMLAERRADEWIALSNDPLRSAEAMDGYGEAISRLQSLQDEQTITRVVPVLRSQQQILSEAGLVSNELNSYLIEAPAVTFTQAAAVPTRIPPTASRIPATATSIPSTATDIPPTATEVPPIATEVPPTATEIPHTVTEVPPTATDVPPTETEAPPTETEVPPIETEVPTEIAPTIIEPTFIPAVTPTQGVGEVE